MFLILCFVQCIILRVLHTYRCVLWLCVLCSITMTKTQRKEQAAITQWQLNNKAVSLNHYRVFFPFRPSCRATCSNQALPVILSLMISSIINMSTYIKLFHVIAWPYMTWPQQHTHTHINDCYAVLFCGTLIHSCNCGMVWLFVLHTEGLGSVCVWVWICDMSLSPLTLNWSW